MLDMTWISRNADAQSRAIGVFAGIIVCLSVVYICVQPDLGTGDAVFAVAGYTLVGLAVLGAIIFIVNAKDRLHAAIALLNKMGGSKQRPFA
jgi:cell division protein FtsW (lipid II flippase)